MSKRTLTAKRGSGAADPVWQVPTHLVGLRCILCHARFRDGDTHGETDHTNWGELTCRTRKVEVDGMDIGGAIRAMRDGKKVTRAGWNGKGMWLALQVPDEHSKMGLPYVYMHTVQEKLVPWLCSQTDLLATDWEIVP